MRRRSDQAQGVALQVFLIRRFGIIYQWSQTLRLELGGIKFELSRWRFKTHPKDKGKCMGKLWDGCGGRRACGWS